MNVAKIMGLLLLAVACTTTQPDGQQFQDGIFTAASYNRDLDERDLTMRSVEDTLSEASVQNVLRREFYLPAAQLRSLSKRAEKARERLNSQSAADPDALRILAVEALVEGRPEQVQAFVRLAKSRKARREMQAEDQLLIGIAAFMLGDVSGAKQILADAASVSPSVRAAARANLGLIAMKHGAFMEALDMFQQAESLEPKNVRFLHMVAEGAHTARRHSVSVEKYRKIISIDKNDFLAHYNLGLVYHYGLKRYSDARKQFQFVLDHPRASREMRILADGAFANVRREEEGIQGIATTGFQ
jgi:tetratricopeptide (TPR) repeat protein